MIANKDAIILIGSSRKEGNTKKIVDCINEGLDIEVVHLIDKKIGYFDYEYKNQDDDFGALIKKVIEKRHIIFATPVYWYAMSAPLKTFFDRLSDLLHIKKDTGRQLKGKNMWTISCGSESLNFDFYIPFKKSAEYLHMNYQGDIHAWVDSEDHIPKEIQQRIRDFSKQLKASI